MRPHGYENENLCSLCSTSNKTIPQKPHPPNNDILPETKEELKEFTKNLERKNK